MMLYHNPLSKARAGLSYRHIYVGRYINTCLRPFSSLYRLPLVRTSEGVIYGGGVSTIRSPWSRFHNPSSALVAMLWTLPRPGGDAMNIATPWRLVISRYKSNPPTQILSIDIMDSENILQLISSRFKWGMVNGDVFSMRGEVGLLPWGRVHPSVTFKTTNSSHKP